MDLLTSKMAEISIPNDPPDPNPGDAAGGKDDDSDDIATEPGPC